MYLSEAERGVDDILRYYITWYIISDNDGNRQEKGPSGQDERKKRPRTAFTAAQIKSLEAEFEKNKYLSVAKRLQLSKNLKLTETQVGLCIKSTYSRITRHSGQVAFC